MDVGSARGWDVRQLKDGDWAWRAWAGEHLGLSRSGVEATEAEAQDAAPRELQAMVSEATASAQDRRRLTASNEH
jgi:hypothetical protein